MEASKRDFVYKLGELLTMTNTGVIGCEYILDTQSDEPGEEYVKIKYKNGYHSIVCITCNSNIAILEDVAKSI